MKRITAIICIIFALVMALSLPVSAGAPYQTYTYSIYGTALYSPDAYTPAKTIDSTYMGLDSPAVLQKYYPELYGSTKSDDIKKLEAKKTLSSPADIEVDADKNIYIADSGNNRIIVLDRYYKFKFIIENFINGEGVPDSFSAPQGVYITPDKRVGKEIVEGKIYVCDTNASRIVTFDHDGNFIDIIPEPDSELFEEGSLYKPVAVAVDQYDRIYVVSSGTTEGIVVLTDKGEFTGFIGAQKIVISAWEKLWRNFQTEAQREKSQNHVPTEFNNITGSGDFIYVTIIPSKEQENSFKSALSQPLGKRSGDYAPVKMLNAAGDEIMRRNGFYPPSGEIDIAKYTASASLSGISSIVDVAVGPEKTWSIIDQKRSKVFTYDYDGNLLYAFGDMGRQLGNISSKGLRGVTYQGNNMLLLDTTAKTFTVYERTEYGNVLIQALHNQNERNYDRALEDWREILKRNSNFDTAYIGIGNALYRNNKLDEAMENYRAAYDQENYSVAYKDMRKDWLANYILLIPVAVVAICFAWIKFNKYAQKVNKKAATSKEKKTFWEEFLYVFHVIFHPFDGFWDLKHEKRGSLRAAVTILGLTIAAFYYQSIGQGYLTNPTGGYSSFFAVILSVCVPLALWVLGNWCLTTLFDGEGSFKDIFIATCYSLMPMVLILIPTTIASNFLTLEELELLSVISTFGFIWTGLLIFLGMMVTHDYSMGKNILTTAGTLVAMVCIMFIALLFTTLLGKLVSFVTNIVTELQFRM